MLRPIVLCSIILLLLPATISTARKIPPPETYGRVILNNSSRKAGVPPVVFDHWLHRAKFTCRLCHVDIGFAMQAGATGIRAADNMSGYFCGSCHNGKLVIGDKEVFAACADSYTDEEKKRCSRCHSKGNPGQRQYDYAKFIEGMPTLYGNLIDWEKAEEEGKVKPIDYLEGISYKRDAMAVQKDFSIEIKSWESDVIFSHRKHIVWNGCELCHPMIFPSTKKGTVKYSMFQIMEGEYCGVCHKKVAFSVWICDKCHKDKVQ